MEFEEVPELSLAGVEPSEQPLKEVSGEVLGWKGCVVVLEIAGRGSEMEEL